MAVWLALLTMTITARSSEQVVTQLVGAWPEHVRDEFSFVTVLGDTAFVIGPGSGLQILDVGDPSNIRLRGRTRVDHHADGENVRHWANGLAVAGARAYVTGSVSQDDPYGGYHRLSNDLTIIDVSAPEMPVVLGRLTCGPDAGYLSFAGESAGADSQPFVILADGEGLEFIDVSDPAAPRGLGEMQYLPTTSSCGVVAGAFAEKDGYLYWRTRHEILVIDATGPTQPQQIGAIPGSFDYVDFCDGYLCAIDCRAPLFGVDRSILSVFDVSIPASPIQLGQCEGLGTTGNMRVSGTRIYALDTTLPKTRTGIHVFQIDDPANPQCGSFYTIHSIE